MSVLHFQYVLSTISNYGMTSVVLFLAEAWISLFTSASWLALGPTGFPIDCNGQSERCLNLTIILMQSRGKYFLQIHFYSLIHLYGFVSKILVAQFQLSKSLLRQWYRKWGMPLWRLLLEKDMEVTWTIVNSAVGTTSGYRCGDQLKRDQCPSGGRSWISN